MIKIKAVDSGELFDVDQRYGFARETNDANSIHASRGSSQTLDENLDEIRDWNIDQALCAIHEDNVDVLRLEDRWRLVSMGRLLSPVDLKRNIN